MKNVRVDSKWAYTTEMAPSCRPLLWQNTQRLKLPSGHRWVEARGGWASATQYLPTDQKSGEGDTPNCARGGVDSSVFGIYWV